MSCVVALVTDTSSFIAYLRREDRGVEVALREGRVRFPPIVLAELMSGRMAGGERARLAALLGNIPLCSTDRAHWMRVGALRARLASAGLSTSLPDVHVAQCALDLDAPLLTEDRIFALVAKHVPLELA